MPRTLPLSAVSAPDTPAADVSPRAPLAGSLQVFDPAMCCPTGLCGPGVDPALLQTARDLRWFTANGVTVTRVGLSQEPQAFVANQRVAGLLQAFGESALPAVLVNDQVLCHGRYATREEIVAALSAAPAAGSPPPAEAVHAAYLRVIADEGGMCEPGGGCC